MVFTIENQLFTDTMKSSPGQYGPCGIGGLILETYKKLFFPFNFPFLTLLPDKCPICHFSCIRPYTYENRFRMRSKRRGLKNDHVRIHSHPQTITNKFKLLHFQFFGLIWDGFGCRDEYSPIKSGAPKVEFIGYIQSTHL